MHRNLVSYLKDNRDQIIENWLTEAEVPPPDNAENPTTATGVVPLAFFVHAFDAVVEVVRTGKLPPKREKSIHLDDFLGLTCTCKQRRFGGRICIELHDSGLKAFLSVFDDEWDTDHEFSNLDREDYADLINHALSGLIAREIEGCKFKQFRSDCPFIAD